MSAALTAGLFVGVIYGLFATGLVITYRGSRTVNFAHGEIGMLGTFLFTSLWREEHWPLLLAVVAGVALSAALGVAVERLIARPLSDQSPTSAMIGTFAVGALLLVLALDVWGGSVRFQPPLVEGGGIRVASMFISAQHLLAGAVTVVLLVGLTVLYARTSLGRQFRAVAMSPAAAEVVGIDVNRISMLSWAMGGAVSAIAGILISPLVSFNIFFMTALLVRGLTVALIAGFRSLPIAIGAAIALAEIEAYLQFSTSVAGGTEAILAVAVVVVLVWPRRVQLRMGG